MKENRHSTQENLSSGAFGQIIGKQLIQGAISDGN
jgi:hypothetical protein